MPHFGLICPPFAAHLHSFSALGEELVRRGHRATFILNAGAEVRGTDLPVVTVPHREEDPPVARVLRNATRPSGLLGTLRTIRESAAMTDQLCDGAPELIEQLGVDAIIGDQLEPAAGLLARAFGVPLVSLACALPINRAPGVPLPFLDWPYDPSPRGIERVHWAERIGDYLSSRQHAVIREWVEAAGLPPSLRSAEDCLGEVQIAQVVPGYDFPRPEPVPFHAVGPLRRAEDDAGELPFTPDPSRPLVFASFGTLQGGRAGLWRRLARAVHAAGAQLVIAHGGQLSASQAARSGADEVHAFLPYRAILRHADLCITHGGSNTVLDALACGVPLLVKPFAFDQKGNSARIVHHRLGERLVSTWRTGALAAQVHRLLSDPRPREAAAGIAAEIARAGGTRRAADILEAALR